VSDPQPIPEDFGYVVIDTTKMPPGDPTWAAFSTDARMLEQVIYASRARAERLNLLDGRCVYRIPGSEVPRFRPISGTYTIRFDKHRWPIILEPDDALRTAMSLALGVSIWRGI